jgi:DNA-directed RNA polymerase alpha subunit
MDLKELLGEELYNQVVEKAGDNKLAVVSDGSYIPKDKFNEKNDEVKDLKQQLKDRDTQLDDLKTKAAGNEELTNQIETLKSENEQTTNDFQAKLDKQAFDFALERSLSKEKAKNPKAVKALLDTESIKLDGDKLLGLDEQLKSLKENEAYLFDEEQPGGSGANPANPGGNRKNPWAKETFNLTEQGKLMRDNPDLAKQLQAAAK